MDLQRDRIIPVFIEEEMKDSYIDYSMSVIVSRALPDVRDGLKPVHRRVLYGMHELNLRPNSAYKKSARVVGEVLGKYHPHGDLAVYDTIVRMAQDFSLRYPLVDGQGNFGSVDGDSPAAMRYTEVRLTRIAEEVLRDLEKDTVNWNPNFDDTLKEPSVMPTVLPNLLVNGSSGIAVGMATNIPPHNLNEVIDGLVALIKDPEIKIEKLMRIIKGPDFPTGGIIYGIEGIDEAYRSGRGRIAVRARAVIEEVRGGRQNIVITELPYQVNKAALHAKIEELAQEKKIEGIRAVRDESDRDGMRLVVELRGDADPNIVLNNLYKHTQMQDTFGVIMLALVDGVPRVLNLKQMLQYFVDFRHEVVVRRTKFELDKAEKRAHILEGLRICINNIDEIVAIIKKSKDPQTAKEALMKRFKLSEIQAQAILDMRLQRLTGLERAKIEAEYKEVLALIKQLKELLASKPKRMELIAKELLELKEKYGDDRRTEIIAKAGQFSIEDIIAEEDMVITISHGGFIKRFPVSGYRRQSRGGRGVTGATTKEDDFIEHLFIASTHDYVLFFTDKGRCYWLKVYDIPQAGKGSKGRAIINMLSLEQDEKIAAFVSVKDFDDAHYVAFATRKGVVKKTVLSQFGNPRRTGINAMVIDEGDALIEAKITDGSTDIMLGTRSGKAIRFHENEVREMGRGAAGVKGIELESRDHVVGMVILKREATILVVSENGYGKRSELREYKVQHRGGSGLITMKATEKTGKMVSIMEVVDDDDLMIITTKGVVIRQNVRDIKIISRNTSGVRLIKLDHGDRIADVARVISENGDEQE
ncbi:MAG: DNA gyrase subunit A [candidate division KSB1 bacterium]|nr:DNA gyrase subunit A [candidate division KSB1 bacterium]MDZ7301969.1 DNA gyrase subunit A [candidate division KSB1 bacterium]MDZ7312374.1 DNA gyrase subunit A [candidate division KSB1 bacterium]